MRIEKPNVYFKSICTLLRFAMLCVAIVIILPSGVYAWPSIVTENNLREAVLEKSTAGFSSEELALMDVNKDGILDVSDLVYYLKTQEVILSIAEFDQRMTTVSEGSGVVTVSINFSEEYVGLLKYSENGVSKEITVNGTNAVISVTNTDDSTRSTTANIINLEIVYDSTPGILYAPGAASIHTVVINENDTLWNGTISNDIYPSSGDVFMNTSINIHFQIEIIIEGSTTTASIITDGNGIIPMNGASNQWAMTGLSFTTTEFSGSVSGIAAIGNSAGVDFTRSFQFSAVFNEPEAIESWARDIIEGNVTEHLESSTHSFLNRESTGVFVLFKDNSAPVN